MENNINRLALVLNRANKLYKKHELSVPVDLNKIIKEKKINLVFKENQHGIDGYCELQKSPPKIVINTEVTFEPRIRFTIAHEIGHICIPWHTGIDLCSLDDPYIKIEGKKMINTQEFEANAFASELLMPTEWIKANFNLDTDDLSKLVLELSREANTSITACFYALEKVLPSGNVFLVETRDKEFWRPFYSSNTSTSCIPIAKLIPIYDRACYKKYTFTLSQYNVIHYKVLPINNLQVLQDIYIKCEANIEKLLLTISDHEPIRIIPYIDKILENLDDKFYIIIQIGNIYFRTFKSKDSSLSLYDNSKKSIDDIYSHIESYFQEYGKMELSEDSYLIWIKECWRGNENDFVYKNPEEILRGMIAEIHGQGTPESDKRIRSINGIMSTINQKSDNLNRSQLFHCARLRFESDPKWIDFSQHPMFTQYLSCKLTSLINKKRTK